MDAWVVFHYTSMMKEVKLCFLRGYITVDTVIIYLHQTKYNAVVSNFTKRVVEILRAIVKNYPRI